MRKRTERRYRPCPDRLDDRCLLTGYSPAQITAAYGLNAISLASLNGAKVTGDGTGQTIAIIETYHDPNIQASLDVFDAKYGLPGITLNVINQAGNLTDGGWAAEESLDVEWAHAIAPGAAIAVVEAAPGNNDSQAFQDFLNAVQTASAIKGVSVVSMSLGGPEFSGESASDSIFSTAGITYVASSGDSGTVEWPSVAPDVLAVGGTTLRLSASSGYGSEIGWAGAGGGVSVGEREPSYQNGAQSTAARSTPDVSFDANPTTGVAVFYIPPTANAGAGKWGTVGGTSVGAPAWAGILAIVNQGRALLGQPALTGATQTLPAIYALPAGDFRKVSLNYAISSGTTNLAINTANYNTQTGLGTPLGSALVADLIAAANTSSPPPSNDPPPPAAPPAQPPPRPVPPPFTVPTPIPITVPVAPITYAPAPVPAPVSRPPTPPTPPPAAPPTAIAKKKPARHKPKHHAKAAHPISRPKATAKTKHKANAKRGNHG
jgi:subtilase family serine protease